MLYEKPEMIDYGPIGDHTFGVPVAAKKEPAVTTRCSQNHPARPTDTVGQARSETSPPAGLVCVRAAAAP